MADLLLKQAGPAVHAAALDLLERHGAVVSIASLRLDGWFEKIATHIENFPRIAELLGERFLAYSIILGLSLRSVIVDPLSPSNTTIEFSVTDEAIQTLPLGEFRVRLVQAVLHDPRAPVHIELPIKPEEAVGVLGGRIMLLGPLFGLSIESVVVASADPEAPRYLVGYFSEGGFSFLELRQFEELLRAKVRRDLAGTWEQPFKLDLGLVDKARTAASLGDMDGVIATLEAWPGLLSILHRTQVGQDLESEQRDAIAEGLLLLGRAFERRERESWSEELYRLGLQYVKEGPWGALLYQGLGELMMRKERPGEAIGVLRRAQALGRPENEVVPLLGRAFFGVDKIVPAAAFLEQAALRGWLDALGERSLRSTRDRLVQAGLEWPVLEPKGN
ncbi:MAG: hypothetical protein MUC50_12530 [Myxococcota bacterium]|jgi:hypothetical protein|nr:hypothetical protein [Myxococcota bacterium]